MNKIVFIISDLEKGGAQKVLVNMANYLKRKNKIIIVTLFKGNTGKFEISKEIKQININFVVNKNLILKVFSYLFLIFKLRGIINKEDPNRIISFLSTTNILTILSCIGINQKLIVSERNDIKIQKIGNIWRILRYFSYKLPSKVSANSQNCIDSINFVKKNKLFYLSNYVEIVNSNIKLKKRKIILAVGRLNYQKGFDILIEAFTLSNLYKNGWQLHIIGEGECKEILKKQSNTCSASKFIYIHGQKKNIDQYYKTSSIFVLPSRFEGMPNVLLEAISYRIPCIISSSVKSAFEFLKHKESCISFESLNIRDLSSSLSYISKHPVLKKKISENAFKALNKKFKKEEVYRNWEKVIKLIN